MAFVKEWEVGMKGIDSGGGYSNETKLDFVALGKDPTKFMQAGAPRHGLGNREIARDKKNFQKDREI